MEAFLDAGLPCGRQAVVELVELGEVRVGRLGSALAHAHSAQRRSSAIGRRTTPPASTSPSTRVLPGDRLTGLAAALRPGGRLLTITYPVPTPELIGRDDVELSFVLDLDADLGGMRDVGDAAVRGEVRATIGRRYRLDDGPQACADFIRVHTTGKLVVTG